MKLSILGFLLIAVGASLAAAEDVYYRVPLTSLEVLEGEMPKGGYLEDWQAEMRASAPWVVMDGAAEAYLPPFDHGARSRLKGVGLRDWVLLVRAPDGAPPTGRMYLPTKDWSGMVRVAFRVPGEKSLVTNVGPFQGAKAAHYQQRLNEGVAGSAWFRRKLREARPDSTTDRFRTWNRRRGVEDTFDLFTGGRAVSENLQLDRSIPVSEQGENAGKRVDLDTIAGITVEEYDWKPHLEGLESTSDPLAAMVPADQYVVFFKSFQALVDLTDAADAEGSPLLFAHEMRAEDALTKQRYERQLCVGINTLTRVLGPKVIRSVAFTGSDPYLRTGSDVALIFEPVDTSSLRDMIALRIAAAVGKIPAQEGKLTGVMGDVTYSAVVTPDRVRSSYLAVVGKAVVLTNSLAQLERIAKTARGELPAMNSLDEYRFFRARYRADDTDETGLMLITDAAIRKWCGPRWRIAASRRLRAASRLADEHARHCEQVLHPPERPIALDPQPAGAVDMGRIVIDQSGAHSSVYGTLDFLTPISELSIRTVTVEEKNLYERWREGYQRNWSNFFDPIAARFHVSDNRMGIDVTVMPLIGDSDYSTFVSLTRGAKIAVGAGDRHAGQLLNFTMALNKDSEIFRSASGYLSGMARQLGAQPFDWLGTSMSLWAEDDPYWSDLQKAEDQEKFMETNLWRMPVALRAEVSNPMKLTLFMTTVRSFVEGAAPGMTLWETRQHKEQPYVRIGPSEASKGMNREMLDKFAIYYLIAPDSLTFSLSEDLIRRAIDRRVARAEGGDQAAAGDPLLGEHLCVQVDMKVPEMIAFFRGGEADMMAELQRIAWGNLFILNEYKRIWPDRDPVQVHEQLWGIRLVCPGGGRYAWNQEWQTMESTTLGHPGQPRRAAKDFLPLQAWKRGNFGLTFENDGLRAAAQVTR